MFKLISNCIFMGILLQVIQHILHSSLTAGLQTEHEIFSAAKARESDY